ncbi:MAG: alpha/beta hydrolase [Fibrobacteres bacterium]|nr:alpha/beta hydrolase [Fibrobacterota bacterium]
MSSFRSKLILFMLKYKHLFQKKSDRIDYIDESTSIPKLREIIERGAESFGRLPKGMMLEPITIGALYCEWIKPLAPVNNSAILYLHGGGLNVGSAKAHRGIVAKFVKGSNVSALVVDYGLAPEKPFPNGLNDCVAAYDYLLTTGIPSNRIVIAGDSGGGNLVLTTLLALKEQKKSLPSGAVALSPWTDLTNSGESWKSNAEVDKLTWKNSQNIFARNYVRDNDPKNPLISPLFGDLTRLPPIRLYAGGHEQMLSDSTRFAEKAKAAGVDIVCTIGEGLFHCYPACAPLFPEASKAMIEICEFIKAKCSGTSQL